MPHRPPTLAPPRRRLWPAGAILAILVAGAFALQATARAGPQAPAVAVLPLASSLPAVSMLAIYPTGAGTASPGLPVVFFNPGWRASSLRSYVGTLRTLAQEGFIVVGVERERASMDWQGDLDMDTETAYGATLARADAAALAQAGEMSSLLDALRPGTFPGVTADLSRVGIFGHSFGGAVAFQTCLDDPRFGACANIDGWLFGPVAGRTLAQPWLLITDELRTPDASFGADEAALRGNRLSTRNADWAQAQPARAEAGTIEMPGTGHGAFIRDESWRGWSRDRFRQALGRPDPAARTSEALGAFFGRWLGNGS